MAVPKKRTSKSKTRSRKAVWKRQAVYEATKAVSLAKSSLGAKELDSLLHNVKSQEN